MSKKLYKLCDDKYFENTKNVFTNEDLITVAQYDYLKNEFYDNFNRLREFDYSCFHELINFYLSFTNLTYCYIHENIFDLSAENDNRLYLRFGRNRLEIANIHCYPNRTGIGSKIYGYLLAIQKKYNIEQIIIDSCNCASEPFAIKNGFYKINTNKKYERNYTNNINCINNNKFYF